MRNREQKLVEVGKKGGVESGNVTVASMAAGVVMDVGEEAAKASKAQELHEHDEPTSLAAEAKTMRWATFLPPGASLVLKPTHIDHDLVLRNLICKTTYLNLHAVEHDQKTKLLDVRTGGNDATVRQAVLASNPLVFMHRKGHTGANHRSSSTPLITVAPHSTTTSIVPMRIQPFPYRVVHRLLTHLKEYIGMGVERAQVTFCPLELMRVLTAVVRAAGQHYKKVKETIAGKGGLGGLSLGGDLLGGGTRGKRGRAKRGRVNRRRQGLVMVVKEKVVPPQPLTYTVADMFGWSTELLRYAAKDRLALLIKYTSPKFRPVSEVAASYWKKAAVHVDRLEGLAYEVGRRAGEEGRVGSVGRFHALESKVMGRWNVLTLLNEFDVCYNVVVGVLAILFVRFHDVVEWEGEECYMERMVRMRTVMRRELTPAMAGSF